MLFSPPSYNLKQFFSMTRFHSVLFIFFLLSLPFSIRKILSVFSPDGSFNEYLDVSIYLSDVLLIAVFVVFILENKKEILSISYWRQMFHVEHLLLPIFIPVLLIFWSGLSILWSESASLAVIAFFRLIEGYLLYLYILVCNVPRGTLLSVGAKTEMFHVEHLDDNVQNVPRGTFIDKLLGYISQCSTWNILQISLTVIIISGSFQSIAAILQFIKQKSLGLTLLKESIFSIYDPGVAKIVINGDVFIRSYGFFPHPNILGGFLAMSLIITIVYPLIFKSKMFHVEHYIGVWLYRGLIFTQLLALSLSFSKSAIVAFIIGLALLISGIHKMFHVEHLDDNAQNVPRGTSQNSIASYIQKCSTWNICRKSIISILNKMFHVEHLVIVWVIIMVGVTLFSVNLKLFIVQPFTERLFYISSIKGLSEVYLFEGLGIGQYVFDMQRLFIEKLLPWQLQPIHNVFLLIFSEIGLVGLVLFLGFLTFVYLRSNKNVPRGTSIHQTPECSTWNIGMVTHKMFHVEQFFNGERAIIACLFRSLLIMIIFIMLFDHYFWDIQQGQFLLWIILAFATSNRKY